MSQKIGKVKSGKSRSDYVVYWNAGTKTVYTQSTGILAGKNQVGKAKSAAEAMNVAEAALYNK